MMVFKVVAAGVVACALVACSQPAGTPSPNPAGSENGQAVVDKRPKSYDLLGQAIPPFRAELVGGGSLTEADLTGKWTVIDFWGIWCSDCMKDAPHVEALHRAVLQDPDLRFISVHVDKRTGAFASVQDYVTQKQIGYPVLLDPEKTLYEAFRLKWVPTYLVVDPQGVVRGFRTDLSVDKSPEGGVKAFIQEIAALRKAQAS